MHERGLARTPRLAILDGDRIVQQPTLQTKWGSFLTVQRGVSVAPLTLWPSVRELATSVLHPEGGLGCHGRWCVIRQSTHSQHTVNTQSTYSQHTVNVQ